MNQGAVEHVGPPGAKPGPRLQRTTALGLAIGLAVLTAAVYAPVRNYGFIFFDDDHYVSDNPHVRVGLTRDSIVWALTQPASGTWQQPRGFYAPLAGLSYLLDSQLFGPDPGMYHIGNVVLHVINTLLLFAILLQMTAQPWRSAWVAGMFALHPLHIESVAWIAERKDVLSTCFWMLTTLAYIGYVRRPGVRRYTVVLAAYVAALLSKPMVVTLPFALLLLDVWPLRRVHLPGFFAPWDDAPLRTPVPRQTLTMLLAEKLPLLPLAAIGIAVAFGTQRQAGAHAGLTSCLADRFYAGVVSYAIDLVKLFWPTGLTVLYPFQPVPPAQVIVAAALLLVVTVLVAWGMRRHLYLAVGWLWYLGILLPTLVQTLNQGVRADRYTYIPSIGLFVIIAWGVPDLLARWRHRRVACAAAAVAALAGCIVLTMRQLPTWRDSLTLFRHALTVTHDNLVAEFVVANELLQQGQPEAAFEHFVEVTRIAERRRRGGPQCWDRIGPIEPYYDNAEANIGLILVRRGDLEAAKQQYLAALASDPTYARAHYRLGLILAQQGDVEGAVLHYRAAVRGEPEFAAAHNNLAITLEHLGQIEEALSEYAAGVRLEPENAQSRCNLAAALMGAGRLTEAIAQFRAALQLQPQLAEARLGVASAYAQAGQSGAARAELEELLHERPDWPPAEAALAWLLATAVDAPVRDGGRAVELAEDADRRTAHDDPEVLNALAAAYAANGRFREAVTTAEQALALAQRRGVTALLAPLAARLAQYRAGEAGRDGAARQ